MCIISFYLHSEGQWGRTLRIFNVFLQSIKTTNKSNLTPCCTHFFPFSNDFDWMQQTLGYHKLSFDSYHWMNMENKLVQAGFVCMPNTITVNQYPYTQKIKHVLNTTGDFYSVETKKNQVLFLSLSISDLS